MSGTQHSLPLRPPRWRPSVVEARDDKRDLILVANALRETLVKLAEAEAKCERLTADNEHLRAVAARRGK